MRVVVERGQPLADGPLGVALAFEDRVDPAGDFGDLAEAHLVHFGGGEIGRRRLAQRLGIDLLTVGQAPSAVARPGRRLQPLHCRDLAIERGIDAIGHDRGGAVAPIAGDALVARPLDD